MIELVMVLIIVGIMAVATESRFFSTSAYDTQVYYEEVRNSIRYARKLAVASGKYIQVSLTATTITLQSLSACPSGTLSAIIDPATEASGYLKTAPGSVTLTYTADWPLYFNGLGQALRASTCAVVGTDTVTIVGGNTVTVVGQTGFVQ